MEFQFISSGCYYKIPSLCRCNSRIVRFSRECGVPQQEKPLDSWYFFVYYHWPQVGVVPRMIDPSSPCHFGVISTIRVYPTISNVPKICNQHLGLLTFVSQNALNVVLVLVSLKVDCLRTFEVRRQKSEGFLILLLV